MNRIQLMIVGETAEAIQALSDRIHPQSAYHVVGHTDVEQAITQFQQFRFDAVLIGATLDLSDAKKIQKIFKFQDEDVLILSETEDGLAKSIVALEDMYLSRKAIFSFNDDALKYAKLHINLS